MTAPQHDNWIYRNKSFFWNGSDQENKFKLNLSNPDSKVLLEQFGWDSPECITYQFNSQGFRDQEFDSRECGLAFGCSFTQGVGVSNNDTWPRILSDHAGIHVWNLGIGGCGLDTIFRISEYYIRLLEPKFVVLLEPAPWRIEYATSPNNFTTLLPNTLQVEESGDFIKNWFAHDVNSILNRKKNIQALKYVCHTSSIPLHILDTQQLGNDFQARDLLHPGKQYHLMVSQMFDSMISN